jgi:hypothetical protein
MTRALGFVQLKSFRQSSNGSSIPRLRLPPDDKYFAGLHWKFFSAMGAVMFVSEHPRDDHLRAAGRERLDQRLAQPRRRLR